MATERGKMELPGESGNFKTVKIREILLLYQSEKCTFGSQREENKDSKE